MDSGDSSLSDLEYCIRLELQATLRKEELLWAQKARTNWLKNGDRNTKFYQQGGPQCYSSKYLWNGGGYAGLSPKQILAYRMIRKRHLVYDYCTDRRRYSVHGWSQDFLQGRVDSPTSGSG
ncbi:putative xyloglucan endotransglucosylase/hydrolase protein 7 [Nymphaea thermarum]|nr:putative xyloglucan endotransglucosylase/hydrolase protein 7 [Nymphaea thermarum]